MKTILTYLDGAVTLTEDAGVISLNIDGSLGGGSAAGVIKGSGSLQLSAEQGVELGEALLNSHLPAALLPLVQVVEGIANQALKSLE